MESGHGNANIEESLGFRVVIDVVPDAPAESPEHEHEVQFTALASTTALPDPDLRAFDHHETLAFASANEPGEAASAVAAVVAAWLSEATLTTDRLWRIYGDAAQDDTLDI